MNRAAGGFRVAAVNAVEIAESLNDQKRKEMR